MHATKVLRMIAWIVTLLVHLQASIDVSSAERIAEAINHQAQISPLYSGDFAVEKTIVELVALAARESRFVVDAVGYDGFGESYGLYQIHETNLKRLQITRDEALHDADRQTFAALILLRESHRVCRASPLEEQLAHYASGRGRCDLPEALADSRNRMRLALHLLRRRPRWIERREHILKRSQERIVDKPHFGG